MLPRGNKSTDHHEAGQNDVFLGEATLPFSHLKRLPFHYVPIRIIPPASSSSSPTNLTACVEDRSRSNGKTPTNDRSHSIDPHLTTVDEPAQGLLGVRLSMVCSDPSIPDLPPGPGDWGSASWSRLGKERGGVVEAPGTRHGEKTEYGAQRGPGIALKIYEAENLVRGCNLVRKRWSSSSRIL